MWSFDKPEKVVSFYSTPYKPGIKSNIGQPVIDLLASLNKYDDWDFVIEILDTGYTYIATNKEDNTLFVKLFRHSGFGSSFKEMTWLTEDEEEAIKKVFSNRIKIDKEQKENAQRQEFGQRLANATTIR